MHSSVSLRHSHPKVGAGRREMAGHNVVILRLAREGGREGILKGNNYYYITDLLEKELSRWIPAYH